MRDFSETDFMGSDGMPLTPESPGPSAKAFRDLVRAVRSNDSAIAANTKAIETIGMQISGINRAFPKNDLGEPGYEICRARLIAMGRAEDSMDDMKRDGAKKFVGYVMAGVLALLVFGAASWVAKGGHF